MGERADSAAVLDAPFGWPARVWLTLGTATHLVGAIVLLVALTHHDAAGTWAPSASGIVDSHVECDVIHVSTRPQRWITSHSTLF
jgi:hypothetical protein